MSVHPFPSIRTGLEPAPVVRGRDGMELMLTAGLMLVLAVQIALSLWP